MEVLLLSGSQQQSKVNNMKIIVDDNKDSMSAELIARELIDLL